MSDDWPPPDLERRDLGHGVSWTRSTYGPDGTWVGILVWHPCVDPDRLGAGAVLFASAPPTLAGARWTVEDDRAEHLTLSPSILCRTCGHHGFVRAGRWVPA